ncbi:MAG: Na-K-Cl cotransporter [Spirulina sp. SIO3F2]|nr:Na-K-Cl cotransporter [Spirulina sp. SIO3F2]
MTHSPNRHGSLGMFGGVYTPSVLTILGVIMYLRFGWVVGNVGLLGTLVIVTLSTAITFITALSVSAIATDRVVRVGGAYYMISRSLGIETGGAVGIPLYFAQALSVALYTLGFAESLAQTFPHLNQTIVALITTIAVAILALTSANIAIRTQYFIMAAIALSLLSFGFGQSVEAEPVALVLWNSDGESFWRVFAVFFPAVTGIMAGVSMSGDLRNPTQAIPWGTMAAVLTGYVIYMVLPVFLAFRADSATLIAEPLVMQRMALWGPAILFGVWGATLSSAIGSILGAPRVLQAIARDDIFPKRLSFLGQGSGPDDEPRLGTVVTLGVAIAAVCIGELNLIAPVLTMFFLTTYLVLNISAGIEVFLQSPSFRPLFRAHWSLSILGAVACLAVMILINAIATVVAAVIVISIYAWLQKRELVTTWGDTRRGLWMALLRASLLQMRQPTNDPKNWRPHVLVLSGIPRKRWPLVELANSFTHNRGLITVASVLPSGSRDLAQQAEVEARLQDYLDRRSVPALVRVVTADNPFEGAQQLVATYGLGSLVPNTILFGDSEDASRREAYCQMLRLIHEANRSLVVLRENPERGFGQQQRIDVWWGGMQANGSLMLLLAYLLRSNMNWHGAEIFVNLVVADAAAARSAETNLKQLITTLRIGAIPNVIVAAGRAFPDILHESSQETDLIFLGMAQPHDDSFKDYYEQFQAWTVGLPTILLVLAAPNFPFEEVLNQET